MRDDGGSWIFESDTMEVKENLHLLNPNISVKLVYQYHAWMAIDDGDGSTPQYITQEVEVFIQMRRHVEEVNFCVTVSRSVLPGSPAHQCSDIPRRVEKENEPVRRDDEEAIINESDQEWHEFAMSETPLTLPQPAIKIPTKSLPPRKRREGLRSGGITIHEGEGIIRLTHPTPKPGDKGKGIAEEDSSSTDSDDDLIQPLLVQTSLPRAQLDEGLVSDDEMPDVDEGSGDGPAFGRWGRFEEALHHIPTDISPDPSLFGRDAPPVFSTSEGDAVEDALADAPYEGDKLFVGRVFKSKTDCKTKIAIHAIN
ncbi:unnamed protein product [Microthlaspi erraticum]|uniref:Transposase MuDR plant domain-containing protein n=1 Tax=Microthlaspi erraticum TaxID=1685480 RepID=A0A6D2JW26_9BRAS|nr:unnamed protein product [Microthlaspi erraticum]